MRYGIAFGEAALKLAVIVFALSLSTVLLAQTSPGPSPVSSASAEVQPHASEQADSSVASDTSAIRLGAGDLVEINVYDVPELTTKTRVSSTGNIYLPLINYVHVDGLTVTEAQKAIEQRLEHGGFVRNPHVQLFVSESSGNGVSILGEVARPGVYPAAGDQSLFSLISAAGGLSDRAGDSITVTHHNQPDNTVVVKISRNFEDHPESNIAVAPGDIVMVRRADVIYIVGDVARPSGFLMDNGGHLSVLQAIALAGGTNSTAKLNGAKIIRKTPSGVTELPVPLKKLLQAKIADVPLQANDILFVPASARKMISGRTAEAVLQMATAASVVAIRP